MPRTRSRTQPLPTLSPTRHRRPPFRTPVAIFPKFWEWRPSLQAAPLGSPTKTRPQKPEPGDLQPLLAARRAGALRLGDGGGSEAGGGSPARAPAPPATAAAPVGGDFHPGAPFASGAAGSAV